jgi:hypothetical protein
MEKDILANPKNVKFADLLQICTKYFGNPRIYREPEKARTGENKHGKN